MVCSLFLSHIKHQMVAVFYTLTLSYLLYCTLLDISLKNGICRSSNIDVSSNFNIWWKLTISFYLQCWHQQQQVTLSSLNLKQHSVLSCVAVLQNSHMGSHTTLDRLPVWEWKQPKILARVKSVIFWQIFSRIFIN